MPDNEITMPEGLFMEIAEAAPYGFSYNRTLFSEGKQPVDFITLYANKCFQDITGLPLGRIIGRRISEISDIISYDTSKWLHKIGNLALDTGNGEFVHYSEHLGKWFTVYVISVQSGYFALVLRDISGPTQLFENLRKILDFSPDLIVVTDLKSRIIDCNNKVPEIFGASSREEMLGRCAFDLIAEKDRKRALAEMIQLINSGSTISSVYDFAGAGGRTFTAEMSTSVVYDHMNKPTSCIGIAKDITERLQSEKSLRASEERFFKAFNSSPTCIAISTMNEGIYLEINDTFLETFGYEREELIGRSSIEMKIWADEDSRVKAVEEIQRKGYVKSSEFSFGLKSGEYRPFLTSIEPLVLDEKECLIFSMNDMSARVKAEEDLKASEEKLGTIFRSSPDAMVMVDLEGTICESNLEMMKLYGIKSREQVIGKGIFEFIDASDRHKIHYLKELVLKEKILKNIELDILLPNKKKITVEVSLSLLPDPMEKYEHIVIVVKDITERKKIESEIMFLSYHDKLTGLYNRAFFETELERLDTKRQLPISLIIGDLNGLKLTNDIFGHTEGDKLLQKVAKIIKDSCRKDDIVARWGGDEFAIILPQTESQKVTDICERILSICSKASTDLIQPSIALGYATKENMDMDIQQLLKEAENWMYRHKLLDSRSSKNSIIASLEKTLFERNYETEEHAQRMRKISMHLGKALGLSSKELDQLNLLSILHDIGKIAIPDTILTKPGKLDEQEWEEMKKHTEAGYRIAKSSYELEHIAEYILSHHERWDGTGYPRGLKGREIPRLSRILSVVDAYDVMTHSRPYKEAMSCRDAIEEIKRCAGSQFDPEVSKIFLDVISHLDKE